MDFLNCLISTFSIPLISNWYFNSNKSWSQITFYQHLAIYVLLSLVTH